MPRIYRIEKEGGDTVEFGFAADAASALRILGMDDYRRFSDDVKELASLKPGDELQPIEGVKVTVIDDDDGETPLPGLDDKSKPQATKQAPAEDVKSEPKPVDAKSSASPPAGQPLPRTK